MFNRQITTSLVKQYDNNVVLAGMDHEEGLQAAIESATSPYYVSDERKADLYARLAERWDEYPAGVQRRMYVHDTVYRWNLDHVFPVKDDGAPDADA